ncbi:heat shock, partial [Tulasnella sp. 408]
MFSSVFRSNWLNDCDKDVAVATVLDTNDGIADLLSGLIGFLKYRRPNFPMTTTAPVPISYGLDKQGTGERNGLTSVGIDSLYEGMDFHTSITLARFEELCQDLFRSSHNPGEGPPRLRDRQTPEKNHRHAPRKDEADRRGKPRRKVTHAVVTVPAYFNDAQRRPPRRQSDHSPYRQRTQHRPIAYGLDKNSRGAGEFHIIDYNLGGGIFDASLLTIENGVLEVLATAACGEDLVQDFKRELKKDLPSNAHALPRQTTARERAKRTLFSTGLSRATTATSPFSAFGDMSNDVQ